MAKHGKRGKIEHQRTILAIIGVSLHKCGVRIGPGYYPFCLANTALMALLHILLVYHIDCQISGQAHGFMSLVVGFLLVQRIATSLSRYDQGREYLDMMNKSCRQLVHMATFYSNTDRTEKGQEWRHLVSYRALLLLRASMAVVDYPSTGIVLWEIPELGLHSVLDDVQNSLPPLQWLNEHVRSDFEWNLRIPVRMSYLLRQSIRAQEVYLQTPLSLFSEADLYGCVNGFMDGYYGIQKQLTAPAPFPLIQMTATFLFFFLFTVPFALLSDDTKIFTAVSHCVVIFILTYGMMGMDLVAIQLDDPFGDDLNDFNNIASAQTAFEEAYITILDMDGPEWAKKLLSAMQVNLAVEEKDDTIDPTVPPTEQTKLLATGSKV